MWWLSYYIFYMKIIFWYFKISCLCSFYWKFITNFTGATTIINHDCGMLFCDPDPDHHVEWLWMLDVRAPSLPRWGLTGVGDWDGSSLRSSVLIATCNWLIACCYLNTDHSFTHHEERGYKISINNLMKINSNILKSYYLPTWLTLHLDVLFKA